MKAKSKLTILALVCACASAAIADEAPRTVYLDGPSDLARLRQVNPAHYARAERILAAANHLCRPGPGELREAAGARDLKCAGPLLKTSNPPKWQITFTLDDTRYVALVTVTDDPPHPVPAR
ncbi:MAG TPA: hypothetical protein VEH00_11070 [Steroidobacteraceae bacterium]|nr:hypothetical protein [Steroidobacteraceae bacterium]